MEEEEGSSSDQTENETLDIDCNRRLTDKTTIILKDETHKLFGEFDSMTTDDKVNKIQEKFHSKGNNRFKQYNPNIDNLF